MRIFNSLSPKDKVAVHSYISEHVSDIENSGDEDQGQSPMLPPASSRRGDETTTKGLVRAFHQGGVFSSISMRSSEHTGRNKRPIALSKVAKRNMRSSEHDVDGKLSITSDEVVGQRSSELVKYNSCPSTTGNSLQSSEHADHSGSLDLISTPASTKVPSLVPVSIKRGRDSSDRSSGKKKVKIARDLDEPLPKMPDMDSNISLRPGNAFKGPNMSTTTKTVSPVVEIMNNDAWLSSWLGDTWLSERNQNDTDSEDDIPSREANTRYNNGNSNGKKAKNTSLAHTTSTGDQTTQVVSPHKTGLSTSTGASKLTYAATVRINTPPVSPNSASPCPTIPGPHPHQSTSITAQQGSVSQSANKQSAVQPATIPRPGPTTSGKAADKKKRKKKKGSSKVASAAAGASNGAEQSVGTKVSASAKENGASTQQAGAKKTAHTQGTQSSVGSTGKTTGRPRALFVEGLTTTEARSEASIRKCIKVITGFEIKTTGNGNILIIPGSHEVYSKLLKPENQLGITIRPTRPLKRQDPTQQQTKPSVVAIRVPTNITEDQVVSATGFRAKRFISRTTKLPTQKVRIWPANKADLDALLKNGIKVNDSVFRCEPYKPTSTVLQCFNCQAFGHHSSTCPTKDRSTCSKCAGPHRRANCTSATQHCANCQESHPSTYKGCTVAKDASDKKATEGLTYAQALTKGNEIEAIRLARVLTQVLTELNIAGSDKQQVSQVVTRCINTQYKSSLHSQAIHASI